MEAARMDTDDALCEPLFLEGRKKFANAAFHPFAHHLRRWRRPLEGLLCELLFRRSHVTYDAAAAETHHRFALRIDPGLVRMVLLDEIARSHGAYRQDEESIGSNPHRILDLRNHVVHLEVGTVRIAVPPKADTFDHELDGAAVQTMSAEVLHRAGGRLAFAMPTVVSHRCRNLAIDDKPAYSVDALHACGMLNVGGNHFVELGLVHPFRGSVRRRNAAVLFRP